MDENPAPSGIDRGKLEQFLRAAVKQGASDVHLKAGERVLLRINGQLVPLNTPPLTLSNTQSLYEAIRPPLKPTRPMSVWTISRLGCSTSLALRSIELAISRHRSRRSVRR